MCRFSSCGKVSKTANNGFRQICRASRHLKHSKTEKSVEAFAIAEIGESTIKVALQRLERSFLGFDAVSPGHQLREPRVARLFEALQCYRLAHQRIVDGRSIGIDDRPRAPLGYSISGQNGMARNLPSAAASNAGQSSNSGS